MFDLNDCFVCFGWFMLGFYVRPFCDRLADWIISKCKGSDSDE